MALDEELHTGDLVDHRGDYFQVDSARIWDLAEAAGPLLERLRAAAP